VSPQRAVRACALSRGCYLCPRRVWPAHNPRAGMEHDKIAMLAARLTIFAASAAVAFVSAVGAARAGAAPIDHFTLSNGLEVVVIPDHRAPVVTHMIWYKVGSADETPGRSGLAHFLEHLMFKGTAKNPSGRFSQVVATIGGQENAFTAADYTGYFQR